MSAVTLPPSPKGLQPGMDHALYPYSAAPDRPRIVWPGGAGLAAMMLVHLEYWELEPPEGSRRDPRFQGAFGTFFPDYTAFTQREYGNRVGIFRLLEALDRYKLPLAVAANAAALERYPAIVDQLVLRGVEFVASGTHANRMITSQMNLGDQRTLITESRDAVARITGQTPRGWAGPGQGETPETLGLLAELGFTHVLDWPNDDQPYPLSTTPPLLSIPRQPDWDDVESMWLRRVGGEAWVEAAVGAFEVLRAEGADAGRSYCLSLHPWVIGQAHRIDYLDDILRRITPQSEGVWWTTPAAVTDHIQSSS